MSDAGKKAGIGRNRADSDAGDAKAKPFAMFGRKDK